MQCSIWQPADNIVGPCAELSFSNSERDGAVVTMHFSLQPGLPNRDLVLRFRGMVAMLWELEGPGVSALPRNLPKCTSNEWRNWTYPLVNVEGSDWLKQYQAIYHTGQATMLSHFLLVSMNDVLQLIAQRDVVAEWVPGLVAEPAGTGAAAVVAPTVADPREDAAVDAGVDAEVGAHVGVAASGGRA